MKLKDRVAVVTGGVSGIGRAISTALAQQGAKVAVNYSKSEADAEETARQLRDAGAQFLMAKADVAIEADVVSMRERVLAEFGRVDILVNNAAITAFVSLLDTDAAAWDRILGVNLRGPFLCTKYFGRVMMEQGRGVIINIGSRAGFLPTGSSVPYCVSKAGIGMLTKCAATALAPVVRVNTVVPGHTQTPWYNKYCADPDKETEKAVAGTPLKRPMKPEEVAAAVVFMASDEAGFITGQTLIVDGGRFMY